MNNEVSISAANANEAVSALADGRLRGEAFAQALDLLEHDSLARAQWHAYHVIGDVLRTGFSGRAAQDLEFVDRLRRRLVQEQVAPMPVPAQALVAPSQAQPNAQEAPLPQRQAANDSRWKWAAGFASVAAVSALAWNLWGGVTAGAQLAGLAPTGPGQGGEPAVVLVSTPHGDVLRDARLVELMAAHKQFGGTSALQMPSGFLRNATFEVPQR